MAASTALELPLSGPGTLDRRAQSLAQAFMASFARNRSAVAFLVILILLVAASFAAPAYVRYGPDRVDLLSKLQAPSGTHLLGTDQNGRDVLSRLAYGGRVSLSVGIAAALIAAVAGTVIGGVAGFVAGGLDAVLMRLTDGLLAIPTFFLLLAVLSAFNRSLAAIIIVIGLTSWPTAARLVRSEVLKFKHSEYVTAARASGATERRLLVRHILPQAMPSVIVTATIGAAQAILIESALSYLGMGIQPPSSSWGNMLLGSQLYVYTDPILAFYPGVLILLSALAFNGIGEGLRGALDPN